MSQSLPHFRVARAGAAPRDSEVDPDLELVERWQGGDSGAFELLVRRHQQRVFGLLLRLLGDRDEALDAAQETFLNLHRHGHRFRREARWTTFLYRVAVNAALNRRRNLGRRRAHMEALSQQGVAGALPEAPASPESAAVSGELRARVQAEIVALPPALRAPVILYDIEGLPYAEIAAALNIPEGTVKSRIHRARQTLRKRLAGLVRESSGAQGGAVAAGKGGAP
ncbi:MAG: sigma-70 family RNA polymerase sigma factor [Deltaproteobacteria bacterium]|nr:sigma-70 family RNA polymerase sigma factor [Deltaproteobacteria bacterium]MDD9853038.1 sigma-70 family RNA polymerase sigma factor [Deltaproteobacteria bacterium]